MAFTVRPNGLVRQLHTTAVRLKNPYFFYDLQCQQGPPAHREQENPDFKAGRRMFDPLADYPQEDMKTRVSRVFGALGSRDESRKEAMQKGVTVAGINVPARPEEPTNCCMSGCINCVWELYKDEIEEYKGIRAQARSKLDQPEYDHVKWPTQLGPEPVGRKVRTGRTDKESAPLERAVELEKEEEDDDDLNEGIKVFIATEKKLHEKRQARKAEAQKAETQKAEA